MGFELNGFVLKKNPLATALAPQVRALHSSGAHNTEVDVKLGLIVIDRIYPRHRPSLVDLSNGSRSAAAIG